jgi:hypothetical protein
MNTWRMIPSGINSSPAEGLLIPEGIIRHVVIVSITAVDTSAGGLLISEGIIRQVIIVSITGSIPLLVDN